MCVALSCLAYVSTGGVDGRVFVMPVRLRVGPVAFAVVDVIGLVTVAVAVVAVAVVVVAAAAVAVAVVAVVAVVVDGGCAGPGAGIG
eukprot:12644271-Alexandrium_andersonii.AAC.1